MSVVLSKYLFAMSELFEKAFGDNEVRISIKDAISYGNVIKMSPAAYLCKTILLDYYIDASFIKDCEPRTLLHCLVYEDLEDCEIQLTGEEDEVKGALKELWDLGIILMKAEEKDDE